MLPHPGARDSTRPGPAGKSARPAARAKKEVQVAKVMAGRSGDYA